MVTVCTLVPSTEVEASKEIDDTTTLSLKAPTSVPATNGYTISMAMMRPAYTPEPQPSVSPLAWLLRAISKTDNDNTSTIATTSTSTSNPDDHSSNNTRSM